MKKSKRLSQALLHDVVVPTRKSAKIATQEIIANAQWENDALQQSSLSINSSPINSWRLIFLSLFAIGAGLLLVVRLAYLQLVHGTEYLERSEGNRILLQTINAPRGVIYDRYHTILARNVPGFRQLIKNGNEENVRLPSYTEALKESLSTDSAAAEIDSLRSYSEISLAHTIGYVSEVTKEELLGQDSFYMLGDRVGRVGLEAAYETVLRGKAGKDLIEVDASGKKLRLLKSQPAQSGSGLLTTLDASLQATLAAHLNEMVVKTYAKGAAAVALDPSNGAVLASVSIPGFDPTIFSKGATLEKIEAIFNDTRYPLLNRAISAAYPPGSTFKLATALAALVTGKVSSETRIEDSGEIFLGPYRFPNWYFAQYGRKEGLLDIKRALARSNDIFFYKAAEKVGHEKLAEIASSLGMGQTTKIDIPGESSGLVPTEQWKLKVKKEEWLPGNTYHFGIGQGDVLATPIQIAALTSLVANRGQIIEPYLVQAILNNKGEVIRELHPNARTLPFQKEYFDLVREGMREACVSGGTGWPFFDFSVPVGCKTGTAEYGDTHKTHAWFTVFAPFDNPKIVLTVFIEGGGEGADAAAPVARKALEWWLRTR